jgi:hypothetical protein
VLAGYAATLGPMIASRGLSSTYFAGSEFVSSSHESARISAVHPDAHLGYDGQFAYFIALDPVNAHYYIDNPGYRYGRILYPVTAWLGAAGQPGALPYSFLAVNLAAVAATVWLLAGFLRRRSYSAWWAAVYGAYPGVFLCVRRDLTEPLAWFLVACALLVFERHPRRVLLSAPFFALAALARETSVVFLLGVAVAVALRGRRGGRLAPGAVRSAALLVLVSLAPVLAYRVAISYWLGSGFYEEKTTLAPLGGFFGHPLDRMHFVILLAVVIPGLVWLALGVWTAASRGLDLALALVVANAALFVVWLPRAVYVDFTAASRASTALVFAAILAVPSVLALGGARRGAGRAYLLFTPVWLLAILLAVSLA